MPKIFDSRDTFYRSPFGAVRQNTRCHFKIVLPRSLHCSGAALRLIGDDGVPSSMNAMFWCGMLDEDHEMWECDFTPEICGLYWYSFEVSTPEGKKNITKQNANNEAQLCDGPCSWQLTVYDKDFETPDWMRGGIMYQILPDRFFYSGKEKTGVPEDRVLRDDWGNLPVWEKNKDGIVTNNDFFCGDLQGISEKLDYLESLGVTCVYLNPCFESHSNHRYDTADYSKIDPLLGTNEDFKKLCKKFKKRGIRVILDGVFSHTGSDSIYFNREGRYDTSGAYQSEDSPYRRWFNFIEWPHVYHSWWGFSILPEVNELEPSYNEFINGDGGIVQKWLALGSSGWRLDVADELPDPFIENLRAAAKKQKADAFVLGEVWEDATRKEAYGRRRRFLLGKELDSVMNYPFQNAILSFLRGKHGCDALEEIMQIIEHYPAPILPVLMNTLSTHDSERALTALVGEPLNGRDRKWQFEHTLSDSQKAFGVKLMKTAAAMQYTLPGVPCIYYGDEAGLEGYRDPFNRKCFPWGKENADLTAWYKKLAALRRDCSCLKDGEFKSIAAEENLIAYSRKDEIDAILCAFNSSGEDIALPLPEDFAKSECLIGEKTKDGKLLVPAYGCAVMRLRRALSAQS